MRFERNSALHNLLESTPIGYTYETDLIECLSMTLRPALRFFPGESKLHMVKIHNLLPDRCIELTKDGMRVFLPIEGKCAIAAYLAGNVVALLLDPTESTSDLRRNIQQIIHYCLIAKCRFGVLTVGESTLFFELVNVLGGGIDLLISDAVDWSNECLSRSTPSFRAVIAGMVFELYEASTGQDHEESTQSATAIGANTDWVASPQQPSDSFASDASMQLDPGSSSHSSGAAAPPPAAHSGSAMDAMAKQPLDNQDSAVELGHGSRKSSSPAIPKLRLGEHFPVAFANSLDDAVLSAKGAELLRGSRQWAAQADTATLLVVGADIGGGRTSTGRIAQFAGKPAVAKEMPFTKPAEFFAEMDNYDALHSIQGDAIAMPYAACVYSARSLVLVVERGLPAWSVLDEFNNVQDRKRRRELLEAACKQDKQLALAALNKIHSCGAVHGDAHLGNLGFVGDRTNRRAFWYDLQCTHFSPRGVLESEIRDEIERFETCWREGIERQIE
nr:hypothetical protein HK105_001339 [Polyrhizophydium stewartii]